VRVLLSKLRDELGLDHGWASPDGGSTMVQGSPAFKGRGEVTRGFRSDGSGRSRARSRPS
jgi:hypothetical protein